MTMAGTKGFEYMIYINYTTSDWRGIEASSSSSLSFESMIVLSFDFIIPTCALLSDAAVVLVRGATDSTLKSKQKDMN